ncbi:unnamed protein product [Didymodactylos carnosus]|uniref:F-box domain-containing protein n=1 Tax=Didymodactylos carnosus TaxID=1234261 RepID=A0A813YCN9_9BILA|nr:unnamed protein product [Didymodactylos carnosus]CAF1059464.1 unnamed protein product [Didymodactylos carnosus]CAF3668364.1 unnamed protein product [Didymodactylos carnosus]CAF3825186.1 unnamed protein product [Didymodactylos carnosus]
MFFLLDSVTTMPTIFEDMYNDLFYQLFDYLDAYDIYYSFFGLNKRFNDLAEHKPTLHANITSKKFRDYYQILLPLIHLRLVALKFDELQLFIKIYYSFSKQFSRIRSLTLSNVIVDRLPLLKCILSLTLELKSSSVHSTSYLFQILHSKLPLLKYLVITNNPIVYKIYKPTLYLHQYLETLAIDVGFCSDLFKLFSCLPNIRCLTLNVKSTLISADFQIENPSIIIPTVKILIVNDQPPGLIKVEHIKYVLKYFPDLKAFAFISYSIESINGTKWEQILSTISTLTKFQLQVNVQQLKVEPNIIEIQSKFQTNYWHDKKWTNVKGDWYQQQNCFTLRVY